MRSISPAGQIAIDTRFGMEPVTIIEIDWADGVSRSYADKEIPSANIPGRILQMGELDHVVDILNNNSSQEISIELDDTDGTIKTIFDNHDIHQRPIRVYQWFDGLPLSDKFLIFAGQVSSPIEWSERSRTITLSAVTQLEDREFGFTAEEGQFEYLPASIIGVPWPVVFGKVLDVPALQLNQAIRGTTLGPVGIISGEKEHLNAPYGGNDCSLGMSVARGYQQISFNNRLAVAWATRSSDYADAGQQVQDILDQNNSIRASIASAGGARTRQILETQRVRAETLAEARAKGEGVNPVGILGGEDIVQGVDVTLRIGDGLYTGVMNGDQFTIKSRTNPAAEAKAEEAASFVNKTTVPSSPPSQFYDFKAKVPDGSGDANYPKLDHIRRHGFIICSKAQQVRPSQADVLQHLWSDAGTAVSIASDEPITYIVSITPGDILVVKARKTIGGVETLAVVPPDYYTEADVTYGTVTAKQITFNRPLSTYTDQGWSDDVYVTYESTIGPNTVDILEWIIDNYTDLGYDTATFNTVRAQVVKAPANFAVLDRPNTIQLLRDICYQARIAIWLDNTNFKLKYLPIEPDVDKTITVSDIESESVIVSTVDTESLVTKLTALWRLTMDEQVDPNKFIIRHNVNRYGTKAEEYEWFIYNQAESVLKSATFWTIRRSNSWKKMRFTGFLDLLRLETFDTVELDLPNYVASGSIKAVVESATYDSLNNTVAVEVLVPVKSGTMEQYPFFWPAERTETFPLDVDDAGSTGIGAGATGSLPVGNTDNVQYATSGTRSVVWTGGPNVVGNGNIDKGDPDPSDLGPPPGDVTLPNTFANIDASDNPEPQLSLNFRSALPEVELPGILGDGTFIIDIRSTTFIDSDNNTERPMTDFIHSITEKICLATDACYTDGTTEGQFDFKLDEETGLYGAGTAFLKPKE